MKYLIEFNGKVASLVEHCKDLGIKVNTVKARHYRTGEPYPECLEYYQKYGVRKRTSMEHKYIRHQIEFNGKIACLAEHCRDLGIKANTVIARHRRTGESYPECLEYYQKNGINHKYKVKDEILYKRWENTKQKCENPKHPSYKYYGGRGIKLCERWQNYKNFEADLLESFLEHVEKYGLKETTLDRYPNNDGDYEPNNVRWATRKEQANNRRSNRMVTNGLNAVQIAEKYDIKYETVRTRLNAGWSLEKIINTSTERTKYYLPCNNGTKILLEHCKENNYNYNAVYGYIYRHNLEPHEALAKYLENKNNENIP